MINVTLEELRYAVLHDDRFNCDIFAHDIDHVLEIALMKIGFISMQSPIRIDLENGEALNISLESRPQPMKFQVQELRPEVLAFALLMEQRLREKDAEHGDCWKELHFQSLMIDATAKVMEMDRVRHLHGENGRKAIIKHATDLGNQCMFIADVAGALEIPSESDKGGAGWAGLDQVSMS